MSAAVAQARVEVVLVSWEDDVAARLREEQQAELDRRYADLHEDEGPTGPAGADDVSARADQVEVGEGAADGGGVDDIDPASVLATFLLREDGQPVGGAVLRRSPDHDARTGSIKRMYVVPEHRGRGLSRVLLTAIEDEARRRELRRLVLETGSRQPESIGLYRSAGYTDVEPFGPWAGGSELICLAKDL